MLQVRNVTKVFDGFIAVSDLSLAVAAGQRHAIIGPNGAGKTTFFNVISGAHAPDSGSVIFRGRDTTRLPSHRIVELGIARSFQRANIFRRNSVLENVQVALIAYHRHHFRLWRSARGLLHEEAQELLELVGLTDDREARGDELAHGKQKQLELALALAMSPRLLMLDEPTAGMSVSETNATIALIKRIAERRGLTLLFTEHDMNVVFGLADFISVLHHGRIIASGTPDEVRSDDNVQRVYLGHG